MKRFIAIAMVVLITGIMLASCGGSSASAEGKYVVKTMNGKTIEEAIKDEVGDSSIDVSSILSMFGISSLEEYVTIELKSDKTATITLMGEDEDGTWTQSGSKVTVTVDGDDQEFTLSGNELSAELDGASFVFVKK